jgi:hypothetical protein
MVRPHVREASLGICEGTTARAGAISGQMREHCWFILHLIDGGVPPTNFCGIGAMLESETVQTPRQTKPVPDRAVGRETGSFAPLIAPNKANLPRVEMGVNDCNIDAYVTFSAFRAGRNKAKQSQFPAYQPPVSGLDRAWRGVVDGAVLGYAGRCEVGMTCYWFLSGWRHTL